MFGFGYVALLLAMLLPNPVQVLIGHGRQDLHDIMEDFPDITDFQFEERLDDLVGVSVSGSGEVDDVGTVDLLDSAHAPNGYEYKVIVHLEGDSQLKAVVFLRSSDGLGAINIGDTYSFTGSILDITDWGFWFTSYVRGD